MSRTEFDGPFKGIRVVTKEEDPYSDKSIRQRHLHLANAFDPPEPVKKSFSDILKQQYIGLIQDQLKAQNSMFLGFTKTHVRGLCHKPFFLARMHDWGPVQTHGGRCWGCEGLGFKPSVSTYDDGEFFGIIDCEYCEGTGLIPRTWYRVCKRCNHRETRSEESPRDRCQGQA